MHEHTMRDDGGSKYHADPENSHWTITLTSSCKCGAREVATFTVQGDVVTVETAEYDRKGRLSAKIQGNRYQDEHPEMWDIYARPIRDGGVLAMRSPDDVRRYFQTVGAL